MRVHAERPVSVVAEHDADRVADDRMDRRAEEAEVRPLRRPGLERPEGAVGVCTVEHLPVHRAHRPWRGAREEGGIGIRAAGDLVAPAGIVVPGHFVGRDVVDPRAGLGQAVGRPVCRRAGECRQQEDGGQASQPRPQQGETSPWSVHGCSSVCGVVPENVTSSVTAGGAGLSQPRADRTQERLGLVVVGRRERHANEHVVTHREELGAVQQRRVVPRSLEGGVGLEADGPAAPVALPGPPPCELPRATS